MGYGKMKKGNSYGSKMGKRSSYNGTMKPILNSTETTKKPGFMSESGPHGNIGNIAHYPYIG
jgi:hypothetical protein